MLKVSGKKGEAILIGEDIKVTIHQTRKEKVIVSVDAPEELAVHKEKIYLPKMVNEQDRDAIWRKVLGDEPIELQ
jgi:carbon storage regulator